MDKYQVALLGYKDPSAAGVRAFMQSLREAYNMDEAAAGQWLTRNNGVLYEYDERELAEQGRLFLEAIGGIAEIRASSDIPPELEIPMAVPPPLPKTVSEVRPTAKSLQTRLCPRCNRTVPLDRQECPHCHVLMDKYMQARSGKKQATTGQGTSATPPIIPGKTAKKPPDRN